MTLDGRVLILPAPAMAGVRTWIRRPEGGGAPTMNFHMLCNFDEKSLSVCLNHVRLVVHLPIMNHVHLAAHVVHKHV